MAGHLWLATSVRISNVWILTDDSGRRFVVDSGHPAERLTLLASLWCAGVRRKGDLAGVILTHRHSDHAGNAAFLRQRFGCPVVCHRLDAPALTNAVAPPRLARRKAFFHEEVLCWVEDLFPARSPVDEVLDDGQNYLGFRIVPVPGHTEGSVMLYHERTETLFSGDAILSGPPVIFGVERFHLAYPGFSLDAAACHDHVLRFLRALPPTESFCAGHGPPVCDRAHEKLLRLLAVSERAAAQAAAQLPES